MAKKSVTVRRSAKSGKFVTKSFADKHKPTTETERYRRSTKRAKK